MAQRADRTLGRLAAVVAVAMVASLYAGSPPGDATPPAGGFKPVAPVEMLMYWQDRALGQINLGLVRKDTERVEKHAWLLAELANVYSRRNEDVRYRTWALELREKASLIARLAKEKKFKEGKQAARAAKAICKKCHDVFREDP